MKKNFILLFILLFLPFVVFASFSIGATVCLDPSLTLSLSSGVLTERQNISGTSIYGGLDFNFKEMIADTQLTIYAVKPKGSTLGLSAFLTQGLCVDIDVFSISAGIAYPFEFNTFREKGFSFRSVLAPGDGWSKVPFFAHIKTQFSFKEVHVSLAAHVYVPTNFTFSGKWDDNNYSIKNAFHSMNIGFIASYLF